MATKSGAKLIGVGFGGNQRANFAQQGWAEEVEGQLPLSV